MTRDEIEFLEDFLKEAEYGEDHAERFIGEVLTHIPDDINMEVIEIITKHVSWDRIANYYSYNYIPNAVVEFLIDTGQLTERVASTFLDRIITEDITSNLRLINKLVQLEMYNTQYLFNVIMSGVLPGNYHLEEYNNFVSLFPNDIDLSFASVYYTDEEIMKNIDRFQNIKAIDVGSRSEEFILYWKDRIIDELDLPDEAIKGIIYLIFHSISLSERTASDEFLNHFYEYFIKFGVPDALVKDKDKYKNNDLLQLLILKEDK